MKNIKENIFTKRYPHLDIHGEIESTADFVIKDFINDNIKMKNEYIVIVHGKGAGILKNKTHEILSNDKRVLEYKLDGFNLGATIIRLKVDN